MAKQRPKPTDDMEIQAIKDHLVRQDKMWADEKKKSEEITDRLYELIKEINTILGGSAALGVAGMRQDVKDLKLDVQKLKQSESERGKWIINISSIPGMAITLIMLIGSVLGIISTIRSLTKEPPKEKPQQESPAQKQPQSFVPLHLPEFFPFVPSQELL